MKTQESTLETGCFSCILEELNMSDKPIVLSRACIRDTLLLKRLCPEKMTGLALSLYNLIVQTLRRNQLAPHVEQKCAHIAT